MIRTTPGRRNASELETASDKSLLKYHFYLSNKANLYLFCNFNIIELCFGGSDLAVIRVRKNILLPEYFSYEDFHEITLSLSYIEVSRTAGCVIHDEKRGL